MNGARHRFALGLTCFFFDLPDGGLPFPALYAKCVCQPVAGMVYRNRNGNHDAPVAGDLVYSERHH